MRFADSVEHKIGVKATFYSMVVGLTGECQDTAEDMTVERETKELSPSDLNEQADAAASADVDQSAEPRTPFTTESLMEENRPSSSTPRTLSPPSDVEADDHHPPSVQSDPQSGTNSPLEHDDSSIVPAAAAVANVPKLRLNALLASDPALNPDARNLKILHEESTKNHQHHDDVPASSSSASTAAATASGDSKVSGKNPTSAVIDNAQRVKVFMCLPCGIGFSSRSTLEAHQAYYCSHRKENEEDPAAGGGTGSASSGDKSSTITSGEPSAKSIKTGKQYACTQCSYSADKKVSLNRHMRMHQSSPAPSSNASNGGDDSSSQQIDRYCSECDIRFSNVKTYRAHKQHYCSSRRIDGQTTPKLVEQGVKTSGGSVSPPQARTKTPTPAAAAAVTAQPFIALPTNPILIIPYYLIRAASMIPGPLTSVSSGIANPESTCFSLENGSLKPMATALSPSSIANNQIPHVDSTSRSHPPPPSSTPSNNNDVGTPAPLLTEKNARAASANSCSESVKQNKKDGAVREFAPLDLSLRRSPMPRAQRVRSSSSFAPPVDDRVDIETMMEGKENLSIDSGSMTPEQIVCAPSLPNSPSMSPSPKRRALSPRSSSAASMSPVPPSVMDHLPLRSIIPADIAMKLTESNIIPPLIAKQKLELALTLSSASAAAAAAAAAALNNNKDSGKAPPSNPLLSLPGAPLTVGGASSGQPQIFVKQGVSKCKECNIVFCKYENYLVHKQHYCSARNQEDTENKISTPPTTSNSGADTNPIAYQQLICAACGIKYTSLDNLRAHQKFYCPKGGGDASVAPPVTREKCAKCKILHEIGQPCPPMAAAAVAPQGSYKCPVCDVISLTAVESRKHLETHGSVKAFRCSICRYKGNTLRGMRTHIRMHFDKKTSDFNEENYMSCILEDDSLEIPSPASLNQEQLSQFAAAQQQHQQQQQQQQQQQHQQQQQQHLLQQQSSTQQHSPQNPQQIFNCEICNYSSSYKGNVMRHMKLVHSQPGASPSPEMLIDDIEPATHSVNGDNGNSLPESFTIKTEPLESTAINVSKNNNNATPNHHHHPQHHHPHHHHLEPLTQIKSEPMDVADGVIRSLPSPLSVPPPPPINSSSPLSGDENSLLRNPATIGSSGVPFNQKYCQTCNITFNYMKTYLAHKQYYCKNKTRGDADSPSPVPPLPPSVQSPTMLNKNKENLEAAIL